MKYETLSETQVEKLKEQLENYGKAEFICPETKLSFNVVIGHDDDVTFDDCYGEMINKSGLDLSNHRNWKGGEYGEAAPIYVPDFLRWIDNDQSADYDEEGMFQDFCRDYIWKRIYLYNHSGITISETPFADPYDSGPAGIAFIHKDSVYETWKVDDSASVVELMKPANNYLKSCIQGLDDFLTGNVHYFTVLCSDEDAMSVGGFTGDSGREEAIAEAVSELDSKVSAVRKDYNPELTVHPQDIAKAMVEAGILPEVVLTGHLNHTVWNQYFLEAIRKSSTLEKAVKAELADMVQRGE